MEKLPTDDPRLVEAMEACRPGSDDLSEPALAFLAERLAADGELREAFDRLQRVDRAVAEAFRDVSVPDGLADRIAARLSAAGEAAPSSSIVAAKRGKAVSRRWLVGAAGGAAAVAASIVVAIVVLRPVAPTLTASEVWDGAIVFFVGDHDVGGDLAAETEPPDAYPPGEDFSVSRFPWMRWRRVGDFLGLQGVAYDIGPPGGGPNATLYVVKGRVPGLGSAPPLKPSRTTRNCSVGAWQADGLLHVLVVEGPPRTYENFVRPKPTFIVACAF
jgi:hypothetical protein